MPCSRNRFIHLLFILLAVISPLHAQSLYDVVISLSDRQRVISQKSQVERYLNIQYQGATTPVPPEDLIDWHGIGGNPSKFNVDNAPIGEKIALLNQAIMVFGRVSDQVYNLKENGQLHPFRERFVWFSTTKRARHLE